MILNSNQIEWIKDSNLGSQKAQQHGRDECSYTCLEISAVVYLNFDCPFPYHPCFKAKIPMHLFLNIITLLLIHCYYYLNLSKMSHWAKVCFDLPCLYLVLWLTVKLNLKESFVCFFVVVCFVFPPFISYLCRCVLSGFVIAVLSVSENPKIPK